MHQECSWHVSSMQIFLELQKKSIEGNELKAEVREIAWGNFSILCRQEPKGVVLRGDGNESWRQWTTEYFCGELCPEISLAVLMHQPPDCWEKASDQLYKWVI